MKRKRLTLWGRWCAVALGVTVAVTAITRQGLWERMAMAAAGLRRPSEAVSLLDERLTADLAAGTPFAPSPFEGAGDTTIPDLPTLAPSVEMPPITMMTPPENKGDGGRILTKTMSGGDKSHGIAVTNRSGTTVDVATALSNPLTLRWADTDRPQVLILHTHTTEGYMTYAAD